MRIDTTGYLWKNCFSAFTQSFNEAIGSAAGVFAFAGGITQADTVAPGPADIVGLAIAAVTIVTCVAIAIADAVPVSKKIADTEKKVIASVQLRSDRDDPLFWGVDMYGGNWKLVTRPMDFEETLAWVSATAAAGVYGRNASWGVYTNNKMDAMSLASVLGGAHPCWHGDNPGQYNHYHVAGMLLFGEYKHFHVWYGSII